MEKLQVKDEEIVKVMEENYLTWGAAFWKIVYPHINAHFEDVEEYVSEDRIMKDFLEPYVEVIGHGDYRRVR